MSKTFLENIIEITRQRVDDAKGSNDIEALRERAVETRAEAKSRRLTEALSTKERPNIIAEIKRASPSKGQINSTVDIAWLAKQYELGGAAAISVLTEPEYFGGSLDDLVTVRSTVELPILRKDFIVDEFQVYEAAAAGADAVLLIVATLSVETLATLLRLARKLQMDALIEVHALDEMHVAAHVGADIIGINNRDLHSLDVSLDVSRGLIAERPADARMIAESGLSSPAQLNELRRLGFDGFLIGETLMISADPANALSDLINGAFTQ